MTTGREAFFEVARSEERALPVHQPRNDRTADLRRARRGRRRTRTDHVLAGGRCRGRRGWLRAGDRTPFADQPARNPRARERAERDLRRGVVALADRRHRRAAGHPPSRSGADARRRSHRDGSAVLQVHLRVPRPEEIGIAMRRAFKEAAAPPSGPTFVSIPWDVFDQDADFDIPGNVEGRLPGDRVGGRDRRGGADAARCRPAADRRRRRDRARGCGCRARSRRGAARGRAWPASRSTGGSNFPFDHPLYAGMIAPMNPGIRASLEQSDVAFIAAASAFSPFYPRASWRCRPASRSCSSTRTRARSRASIRSRSGWSAIRRRRCAPSRRRSSASARPSKTKACRGA